MTSDFIRHLIARSAQAVEASTIDFGDIREQMACAGLSARIPGGKRVNLFMQTDQEGIARPGEEENLKSASYAFFINLDKLAMLLYISAESKRTDTSKAEQEAIDGMATAMRQWLASCNAPTIFPDMDSADAVNNLAEDIAISAPLTIKMRMCDVLRDTAILTDSSPAGPLRN